MKDLESSLNQATQLSKDNAMHQDNASAIDAGLKEHYDARLFQSTKSLDSVEKNCSRSLNNQDLLQKTQKNITEIKTSKNYSAYLDGCKKLDMHDKHIQDDRREINECDRL